MYVFLWDGGWCKYKWVNGLWKLYRDQKNKKDRKYRYTPMCKYRCECQIHVRSVTYSMLWLIDHYRPWGFWGWIGDFNQILLGSSNFLQRHAYLYALISWQPWGLKKHGAPCIGYGTMEQVGDICINTEISRGYSNRLIIWQSIFKQGPE